MFEKITAENGITYLRSSLLPCRHGFSTRLGGVSSLPHTSSLNLAFGRGDDEETVLENLNLFSEALGFSAEKTISVPQIHSADVRVVRESNAGQGYHKNAKDSFDGYVTDTEGLPIGVKSADCVPILFAWVKMMDGEKQVRAVGAVHAGWRGTVSKIAEEGVKNLCALGATPKEIYAAIGPCIHRCCYTVGEDVYAAVRDAFGADIQYKATMCELVDDESKKYLLDLVEINRYILESVGVPSENIDACDLCTCCNPELFYSHRASGGVRGTMLSVIVR